ncbi:MAG: hypothetical protein MUF03_01390 [Rubrivivax sp.]|jgi:hypothetical protein|nr:hypothetical protein [Rubrivivax sp.]
MGAALRATVTALSLAAFASAFAEDFELGPSEAVRCLTPVEPERGAPAYPAAEWAMEREGQVRVELRFAGPRSAPEVTVVESRGGSAFVESVRDHVAQFRVPCLPEGGAARLHQEYLFSRASKAVAGELADADDALRRELLRCLRHPSESLSPTYPTSARRQGLQGRVFARLTFRSPSEPPAVETFARPSAAPLKRAVERHVAGLRMPCLTGEVVTVEHKYVFVFDGDGYGFKPLTLPQLLAVADLRAGLRLDTTRMGCPFDVDFVYMQPMLANVVTRRDAWNPARLPLHDAMRSVRLALNDADLDAVFAARAIVTVPCLKIDIPPQKD